jgi:GAF domain-containing protein
MVEAFAKISEASKVLVTQGYNAASVEQALGLVGRALDVDRASVFENRTFGTRGRLVTDQRNLWNNMPHLMALPLRNLMMRELAPAWSDALTAGQTVSSLVSDAPQGIQQLLAPRQVKSILLCPIAPAKEWWGFVAFEDCRQPRRWMTEEVTILRTLSRSLSSALRQTQMRNSLDQARSQLREVVKSCVAGR